ncbi:MAG: exosortase [Dehalococcoidia bacterium]
MNAPLWVGVSLGVVLVSMWPTHLSFHDVWTSYTYSHGYLVAGLAAWFLWRARSRLWDGDQGSNVGFPILLGLGLLWLAAMVMHVRVVHQGLVPLVVVAWALTVTGRTGLRAVLPPASLFLFAVPFWEALVPVLQRLTILVSGSIVRLLGVRAEISGDFVTIPSGTFEVAGTCAGLNFFIVGTFLGTAYAYLFLQRWRSRLIVVVLAAATAVVANWARVVGLIIVGHVTEMTHGLLTSHHLYGWVIFAVAFCVLFWLVRGLERRDRESVRRDGRQLPPLGTPTLESVIVRRSVLASCAFLFGPLLYFGIGAVPARAGPSPTPDTDDRGAWSVTPAEERPFDWRPMFHGAGATGMWVWEDRAVAIYQDRVVYPEQRQGAELISGENRIAAGPSIVAERTIWRPDLGRGFREAVIMTPQGPVLVWYWYRVGGVETASTAWAKLLELWGFIRRSPAAELEALSTRCGQLSCDEAAQALYRFVAAGVLR